MASEKRLSEGARQYALALAKKHSLFKSQQQVIEEAYYDGIKEGLRMAQEIYNPDAADLPPEPNRAGHKGDDLR